MYYNLDNEEFKKIKEIEEVTNSDYTKIGQFISVYSLMTAAAEMLYEYKNKCEELEDLKKDLEENYTRKPVDYGVSDRDFI